MENRKIVQEGKAGLHYIYEGILDLIYLFMDFYLYILIQLLCAYIEAIRPHLNKLNIFSKEKDLGGINK